MTKRRVAAIVPAASKPGIIRVAAYCRVSTSQDGQIPSLKAQRSHYKEVVSHHDGWKLADIYYEEGVSGTKKEIRPELNRLLTDCRKGKIDLILTKSISRFARNTADCLEMVRSLTALDVNLVFEKENIDTGKMDSEFLLTVLSSLAEEESKSLSSNVRWTVKKKFRNGTYKYSRAPYGYNLTGGSFTVSPEEAEVIRWIYRRILEGKGTGWIAGELNRRGIPTKQERLGRGKAGWHSATISGIVRNPVYIGDVLLQKTFHDSRLRRHNNFGEENQYYAEDHHEAIIDRETFELARGVIRRHGKECGNVRGDGAERHKDVHRNRYCFTGKLFCGECGSALKRVTQYTKSGAVFHWACSAHLKSAGNCSLKRVREENIRNAFVTMLNKLKYAPLLLDWYIEKTDRQERNFHRKRLDEIRGQLEMNTEKRRRLALLLSKGCVEPVLYKRETAALEAEAVTFKEEKSRLEGGESGASAARSLRTYIRGFDGGSFEEEAFKTYVEKTVIESVTRFTFYLSCGLKLTEESLPAPDFSRKMQ